MHAKWIAATLLIVALVEPAFAAPGKGRGKPPAPSASPGAPAPSADAIKEKREKLKALNQEEKDVELQIFQAKQAQLAEAEARKRGPRYVFQRGPSPEDVFRMEQHLKEIKKQIAGLHIFLKKHT
jgi:hypothetical protein